MEDQEMMMEQVRRRAEEEWWAIEAKKDARGEEIEAEKGARGRETLTWMIDVEHRGRAGLGDDLTNRRQRWGLLERRAKTFV